MPCYTRCKDRLSERADMLHDPCFWALVSNLGLIVTFTFILVSQRSRRR